MNEPQFNLLRIEYGSRLYGTSTPSSDYDYKTVFVPSLDSLLLGKPVKIYKKRTDADGNAITNDNARMMADGIEDEYIPIQLFVRDFIDGQTYALEVAHAIAQVPLVDEEDPKFISERYARQFCRELIEEFTTSNVYSMVSFAAKQTMDYVYRGERLNAVMKIRDALLLFNAKDRLDRVLKADDGAEVTLLDQLSKETGLPIGSLENNGKVFRTLEMNGRSYMDSTTVGHLYAILEKQIAAYGVRSVSASLSGTEWKSMMHAIRVYEQVLELLDTGNITFPRKNVEYLKSVKNGEVSFTDVQTRLRVLDMEVKVAMETTKLPAVSDELRERADKWLLFKLHDLYSLG